MSNRNLCFYDGPVLLKKQHEKKGNRISYNVWKKRHGISVGIIFGIDGVSLLSYR